MILLYLSWKGYFNDLEYSSAIPSTGTPAVFECVAYDTIPSIFSF